MIQSLTFKRTSHRNQIVPWLSFQDQGAPVDDPDSGASNLGWVDREDLKEMEVNRSRKNKGGIHIF